MIALAGACSTSYRGSGVRDDPQPVSPGADGRVIPRDEPWRLAQRRMPDAQPGPADESLRAHESLLGEIERLQSERAHRDARRTFYVEGVRNVVAAVENGWRIDALVHSDPLLKVPVARRLVREGRRAGTTTVPISPEDFRRVSRTPHASGIGAIVGQRWSPLHSASPKAGLCWIVLEAVHSEGNLGSLLRTSAAFGGSGLILVGPRVDPFDPAVVRASMGAIFHQQLVRTNETSLRHWLRRHRCQGVGASPDGPCPLPGFHFPRPAVVFLGEERTGLSPFQRALCGHFVRIPMVGAADSLNLAVAGSVILYELFRGRGDRGRSPPSDRPQLSEKPESPFDPRAKVPVRFMRAAPEITASLGWDRQTRCLA